MMFSRDEKHLEVHFLVFLVTVLLYTKAMAQPNGTDGVFTYSIVEKKPAGTNLGYVAQDAGLYKIYSQEILQKLTYAISSASSFPNASEYFDIADEIGLLRTKKLINREIICPQKPNCDMVFSVLVQPRDYFQVIKVNVTVIDINDYAPTFNPSYMNISISEATAAGEIFVFPSATDLDSPANGVVNYALVPDRDPFRLMVYNNSGILDPRLNLSSLLDREQQSFYSLKLVASDGGIPPKSGSLVLDVIVLDENDNSPVFDKEVYVVNVSESISVGSELVTVRATDKDSGPNGRIRYNFSQRSQNQYGNMFSIDSVTGKVTLLRALNAAESNSYNLSVQATDGGSEAMTGYAALRIIVLQDSNRPPTIALDFLNEDDTARVQEYSAAGSFVALVTAVVPNSQTTSCSVNDTENFKLSSLVPNQFKLATVKQLDSSVHSNYWVLLTCALDTNPSISSTKLFSVLVIPVSIKPPMFPNSTYTATLATYASINTFVLGVRANFTPVSGRNLTVAYAFEKDSDGRFNIDSQTGSITTTLVYFGNSDIGTTIELNPIAFYKELGNDVSSRGTIRITVTDGGKKGPKFQQNYYNFTVLETTNTDTPIGSTSAVEPVVDSVFYGLVPQSVAETSSKFRIDNTSGVIYLMKLLDSAEKSHYELTVMVQNLRFPDLNDTAKVGVSVQANRPQTTFSGTSNNNTVQVLSSSVGTLVASITVRLPQPGFALCFTVVDYTDLFAVNAQSGEIRLISNISRFINQTLTLEVQVHVCNFPFARSSAILNVAVVNDAGANPLSPSSANNSDSKVIILACVLAICFVLALVVIVAIILVCRRSRRRKRNTSSNETLYVPPISTGQPYPVIFDRQSVAINGNDGSRRSTLADITLELPQNSFKLVESDELDGDSGYPSNSSSSQTSSDDGGGTGGGSGGAGNEEGGRTGGVVGSIAEAKGQHYPTIASSFIGSSGNDVGNGVSVFTTSASSNFYGKDVANWLRASANSLSDRWNPLRRSQNGTATEPPPDNAQPPVLKPSLSRSGSLASRKSIRFAADGTMIIEAKKRVTFAEEEQVLELSSADVTASDVNDLSDVIDSPRSTTSTDDDVSSETSSHADSESQRRTVINTITNSYATGSQYPPSGVGFGNFRPEDGSLV